MPDAFYGPAFWINYNPETASSSQPAANLTVDTHQYYAFAPLNDLSPPEMLDSICNISQLLKREGSGIPPTVVGEWSLQTGEQLEGHLITAVANVSCQATRPIVLAAHSTVATARHSVPGTAP